MHEHLTDFLQQTRDAREYKRAVAVQMRLNGVATATIRQALQVSAPFISKWMRIYTAEGTAGLRIGHKGSAGKLSAEARAQTIAWLHAQDHHDVARLQAYVKETFGVEYRSLQSYYTLLHAAKISWKRAQATNPKKTMRSSPLNARSLPPM